MKNTTVSVLAACVIICSMWNTVVADLEQYCWYEEYYSSPIIGHCGAALIESLNYSCAGNVYLSKRVKVKRGLAAPSYGVPKSYQSVFRTKSEASKFIVPPKRSDPGPDQGIVCECCINTCTEYEYAQYCMDKRRKRSLRSSAKNEVLRERLNSVYKSMESGDFSDQPALSITELMDMPLLKLMEKQKTLNILASGHKRGSSEVEDKDFQKYANLKKYLLQKFEELIAEHDVQKPANGEGNLVYSDTKPDAEEREVMQALWKLIRRSDSERNSN